MLNAKLQTGMKKKLAPMSSTKNIVCHSLCRGHPDLLLLLDHPVNSPT